MLKDVLRKIRNENELTQFEVASLLNIDRSTYTYYETGKTNPDIYQLSKIAKIYKVTPNDLLGFDTSGNSSVMLSDKSSMLKKSSSEGGITALSTDEKKLVYFFRLMSGKEKEELLADLKEKL